MSVFPYWGWKRHGGQRLPHQGHEGRRPGNRDDADLWCGPHRIPRVRDAERAQLFAYLSRRQATDVYKFSLDLSLGTDMQHGTIEIPDEAIAFAQLVEELAGRRDPEPSAQPPLDMVA